MSTPAISNVFSTMLQTPPNGGKSDAAAPDGAFNQVLSREMNNQNRGNATSETAQGTPKDRTDADKAKNDNASAADGSKPAEAGKTVKEDDKTAQADGKTVKDDDKKTDPAATAPADILAFVNALTQSGAGGNATPIAVADDDIKARIASLTDGKGKSDGKLDPTTLGATPAAGDKAGTAKQTDFAATLDKATTAASADKDAKAPAVAASAAKTTEADMAAAAQAVKAMEPAAPPPQNIVAAALASTAALQQHVNELQDPQSNRLLPQVGTDDWGQALGQKISWMVQGAQQTATLTLNPPDLGPMQVVVHVNNNQATANFTAHQPEVRHALEAAMPRLREMLNESGIQLGQSNVSAGLPNQQNNASGDQRQNGRSSAPAGNVIESASTHVTHVPVSSAGNGLVDTFA